MSRSERARFCKLFYFCTENKSNKSYFMCKVCVCVPAKDFSSGLWFAITTRLCGLQMETLWHQRWIPWQTFCQCPLQQWDGSSIRSCTPKPLKTHSWSTSMRWIFCAWNTGLHAIIPAKFFIPRTGCTIIDWFENKSTQRIGVKLAWNNWRFFGIHYHGTPEIWSFDLYDRCPSTRLTGIENVLEVGS